MADTDALFFIQHKDSKDLRTMQMVPRLIISNRAKEDITSGIFDFDSKGHIYIARGRYYANIKHIYMGRGLII